MSKNYGLMVQNLLKDGDEIMSNLDGARADLIHAGMGVSGEAGELLDAIKKYTIYNKPLDVENVVEELGDLEFYMEALRQNLGITREQTLHHNMNKLCKRYSSGSYSDQQAQDRADKA